MSLIDAHIHLDQYMNNNNFYDDLEKWREAGVKQLVAVSTSLASSYQTLELKRKFPDFIYAAIGFHPEEEVPIERDVLEWISLLQRERSIISAIGEVGLPHYQLAKMKAGALEAYLELLELFSELAVKNRLPLILHAVHDKAELAVEVLGREKVELAHFHWLKGEKAIVNQIINSGYFVSVTPEVCYRDRDQELAKLMPVEQLLLETDGPWSFDGSFQGISTTPLMLMESAHTVSQLKGITTEQLFLQIEQNIKQLYGEI